MFGVFVRVWCARLLNVCVSYVIYGAMLFGVCLFLFVCGCVCCLMCLCVSCLMYGVMLYAAFVCVLRVFVCVVV